MTEEVIPKSELKKIPHSRVSPLRIIQRILFFMIGASLVAVALEIFFIPNDLIDGGITGISMILSKEFDFPLGILLAALNIPFLFLGYKQIGKTFVLSTLFAIIVLAIGSLVLHRFALPSFDPLLASVFGGVILGVGVGLVVRFGGSLDGTEIIAIVVNKKSPFSVGEIIMFINFFILGSAGFLFGWDRAMYSFIAYFIAFKMIDVTIEGFDESKSVWIISEENETIGEAILDRLGRGVTYLSGEGGYTGDRKKVIFCVITRLEEAKLKSIVEEIDPFAFLAVGNIHDVKGGRFKKRDIH
jgi:uncharacterized membrane-anchored protein YitT (DUF2179 family)